MHFRNAAVPALLLALALLPAISNAQLPGPNAEGVSTGHVHLNVPDVATHRELWQRFGAEERTLGRLELLAFPGIFLLLNEREPSAPSGDTAVNHIAFAVRDYSLYRGILEDLGARFILDNAAEGQILADLPDGVRVEFLVDEGQPEPIVFHHIHLAANGMEALRDWYLDVFGAEASERNDMPSALVPGGRIDVISARGNEPLPSRGAAIDHIGFEVADMDAFAQRMQRLGITFDMEPTRVDAIGLTIAFITDPIGTYIEITQGLSAVH